MGKSTGRMMGLVSLVVAGLLCLSGAVAYAATIAVGSGNVATAPGTTTFSVTLGTGGATVAGTSNDVTYDSHISPQTATSGPGTCSVTTTRSCLKDADCQPPTCATCGASETCTLTVGPKCTSSLANKNVLFSFLKAAGCDNTTAETQCACTPGTDCTAIRALVAGLDQPNNTAIPDNTTLYTCTVDVAAGTPNGSLPLTNSNVQIADDMAMPVTPALGTNGAITVGAVSIFVCDVAPSTGNNAGEFGNGSLNIADTKALFKASQFPDLGPPAGSDRFSAMDAAPVDVPPACGGQGSLNIGDVKACFKRAQLPGQANFTRTGSGAGCTSQLVP